MESVETRHFSERSERRETGAFNHRRAWSMLVPSINMRSELDLQGFQLPFQVEFPPDHKHWVRTYLHDCVEGIGRQHDLGSRVCARRSDALTRVWNRRADTVDLRRSDQMTGYQVRCLEIGSDCWAKASSLGRLRLQTSLHRNSKAGLSLSWRCGASEIFSFRLLSQIRSHGHERHNHRRAVFARGYGVSEF